MVMPDPNKIRISREILSDGPGYKAIDGAFSMHGTEITTKMHMGKVVETVYVPTSSEWEPPAYLMGKWWRLVNEAGNIVGLKALIPPPERRHLYGRSRDQFARIHERWVRTHLVKQLTMPLRIAMLRRILGPLWKVC